MKIAVYTSIFGKYDILHENQFQMEGVDYLCFTDRRNKKKSAVHFVEVKSGNANLSADQEGIRAAIKSNRVYWHEVNVDGYLDNGKNVITKTTKNKK